MPLAAHRMISGGIVRLLTSLVWPVVTYGCEGWTLKVLIKIELTHLK